MARKIIAKKTITFYEGDEVLLKAIENAAKTDKRNLTLFYLSSSIRPLITSPVKSVDSTSVVCCS